MKNFIEIGQYIINITGIKYFTKGPATIRVYLVGNGDILEISFATDEERDKVYYNLVKAIAG